MNKLKKTKTTKTNTTLTPNNTITKRIKQEPMIYQSIKSEPIDLDYVKIEEIHQVITVKKVVSFCDLTLDDDDYENKWTFRPEQVLRTSSKRRSTTSNAIASTSTARSTTPSPPKLSGLSITSHLKVSRASYRQKGQSKKPSNAALPRTRTAGYNRSKFTRTYNSSSRNKSARKNKKKFNARNSNRAKRKSNNRPRISKPPDLYTNNEFEYRQMTGCTTTTNFHDDEYGARPSNQHINNFEVAQITADRDASITAIIIDTSVPYGKIYGENQKCLEVAMLEAFDKQLAATLGKIPTYLGSKFVNDTFHIICTDNFALHCLNTIICLLPPLWDGCKLKVIESSGLIKLCPATVWIPGVIQEPHVVLHRLSIQHPSLKVALWHVYGSEVQEGNGQLLSLGLDEDSAQLLFATNAVLSYGFNCIKFNLSETNLPNNDGANTDQCPWPEMFNPQN